MKTRRAARFGRAARGPDRRVALAAVVTLFSVSALAAAAELEGYLRSVYSVDAPGASVLVAQDDQIVLHAAFGMADIELAVPMTTRNVFRIGSITKQFTALILVQLEQHGALRLKDPVGQYVKGLPKPMSNVPLTALLTHTGGIRSYTDDAAYMTGNTIRRDLSLTELIDVFDDWPLEFEPGARFSYSDAGYILLGAAIESVTGRQYSDALEAHIVSPLELGSTGFEERELIDHRASGYEATAPHTYQPAAFISMTEAHAARAMVSTTGDLFRWHQALRDNELITRESFARMTTRQQLHDDSRAHESGSSHRSGEI